MSPSGGRWRSKVSEPAHVDDRMGPRFTRARGAVARRWIGMPERAGEMSRMWGPRSVADLTASTRGVAATYVEPANIRRHEVEHMNGSRAQWGQCSGGPLEGRGRLTSTLENR